MSPVKAAYIRKVQQEIPEASLESLKDKSLRELKDSETSGRYCDEGYFLEGDFCWKEIGREAATPGKVCPRGYVEVEGKCFEEVGAEETGSVYCREGYTLKDEMCEGEEVRDAEPSKFACSSGEAKTRAELGLTSPDAGDANYIVCADYSSGTHPVSPCELNDGTEYTVSGGTCYWHRAPVIESGCPGKIQVGGDCWDDASNILICAGARDGKQYSSRDEFCEGSIQYMDATITEFKCPKDFTVEGNRCKRKLEEPVIRERVCPTGSTKIQDDRCISTKEADFVDGYMCTKENTKLEKDTCILLEMVEAKQH